MHARTTFHHAGRGWVVAEGGGLGTTPGNRAAIMARIVSLAKNLAGGGVAADAKPRVVILGATKLDEVDERIADLVAAGAIAENVDTPDDVDPHAPAIVDKVASAHAIFLRGGDQSRYVKRWMNGPLDKAIRSVHERGGVVGGTSAGCAVLGEWTYDSNNGSLSASEALADARHDDLTLTHGFLNLVGGVLFDTHFTERGRVARLAIMLAEVRERREKAKDEPASRELSTPADDRDILGIGVDPETAVVVGPDGIGEVVGLHSVTLLRLTSRSIVVRGALPRERATPPTVSHVRYDQLLPGTRFDVRTGEVLTRPSGVQKLTPHDATHENAFEALTLDGSDTALGKVGLLTFTRDVAKDADTPGTPRFLAGDGRLPGVVVSGSTFKGNDTWEHLACAQRTLASQPGTLAWWMDDGCRVSVSERGVAQVMDGATSSLVVLDATGATYGGVLAYENLRGPAHLEGAMLHVLGPGARFELGKGAIVPVRAAASPAIP